VSFSVIYDVYNTDFTNDNRNVFLEEAAGIKVMGPAMVAQ
jgi:hypothetical protein